MLRLAYETSVGSLNHKDVQQGRNLCCNFRYTCEASSPHPAMLPLGLARTSTLSFLHQSGDVKLARAMPKSFHPQGVVPERVHLSDKQQQVLVNMADGIIAETLESYEMFTNNGRDLPSNKWRHVKSKEKVHVYRSRCDKILKVPRQTCWKVYDDEDLVLREKDRASTHSSSGSFSLDNECVLSKAKPPHVPLVSATGVIDGTLEDVAFGGFANTKYSWIVRSSYVHNDELDDRKVLATLQLPTKEDPFRSVTLRSRPVETFCTSNPWAWLTTRTVR
ncbi:unnamed protein product [Phytophthora fragariaefolia]|uniref:Unnamed protein product n=1 Tax=Phytophthora fragariaefolia TaxID=1490495 RepID=A0A9W6XH26_9STRA|nr:unnamed protein product [Phytophthora fragariaefolia]